jgi:hypothetical protein
MLFIPFTYSDDALNHFKAPIFSDMFTVICASLATSSICQFIANLVFSIDLSSAFVWRSFCLSRSSVGLSSQTCPALCRSCRYDCVSLSISFSVILSRLDIKEETA